MLPDITVYDETLNKLEMEGNFHAWLSYVQKPSANIIIKDGIFEAFPLKSRTRKGCLP